MNNLKRYFKFFLVFSFFILCFSLSVSAYTVSDDYDFIVSPEEVTPYYQCLNLGDGNAFESSSFVYGSYNHLDNERVWRSENTNFYVSNFADTNYRVSFNMPNIPLVSGTSYRITIPCIIQGSDLVDFSMSDYVFYLGGGYDGTNVDSSHVSGIYLKYTGVINLKRLDDNFENPLYTFDISFIFNMPNEVNTDSCYLQINNLSGSGRWRWFGFYDDITFQFVDVATDYLSQTIDSNTDKILDRFFNDDYNPPDSTALDSYVSTESSFIDTINSFNLVSGISDLFYYIDVQMLLNRTFYISQSFLSPLFESNAFYGILIVSLLIGCFGFILGLGVFIYRKNQ